MRGLAILLALAALTVEASGVAVAAGLWLLPSVGAWLLEGEPGRPTTRAMTLFGIAASLRPWLDIWGGGASVDAGLAVALNPVGAATAWAAQGGGWLLAEAVPLLLVVRAETVERRRLLRLRTARTALEKEWLAADP